MKPLNLATAKRTYWQVTLPDETKLVLRMPTKALLDRLTSFDTDDLDVDSVCAVTADVLSSNRQGTPVTVDYVADNLDIIDCTSVIEGYIEYIGEVMEANAKN